MLEIKQVQNIVVNANDEVRLKEMGNITEIMYSEKRNHKIYIKKISDKEYIDLRTGEVKECNKIENRSQNINSIRQSLSRLRDYINTNVYDPKKCKWITLTYKENMTDSKKLYKDFDKFNKRLKYHLNKNNISYEYIVCAEPQGRGAWHLHLLLIFKTKAPYIANDLLAEIWGNGFTSTKNLKNVDNVGAYLTAYLGDLDLDEFKNLDLNEKKNVKIIKGVKEVLVEGESKSIIKGGRLYMYPPKFNLYRCSRGIKKPIVSYVKEIIASKKVSEATLTFERTIELFDVRSMFKNIINYRYYNNMRSKKKQEKFISINLN